MKCLSTSFVLLHVLSICFSPNISLYVSTAGMRQLLWELSRTKKSLFRNSKTIRESKRYFISRLYWHIASAKLTRAMVAVMAWNEGVRSPAAATAIWWQHVARAAEMRVVSAGERVPRRAVAGRPRGAGGRAVVGAVTHDASLEARLAPWAPVDVEFCDERLSNIHLPLFLYGVFQSRVLIWQADREDQMFLGRRRDEVCPFHQPGEYISLRKPFTHTHTSRQNHTAAKNSQSHSPFPGSRPSKEPLHFPYTERG